MEVPLSTSPNGSNVTPETAGRVARTIYDECARLKDFPNLGRTSRHMTGRYAATARFKVSYRLECVGRRLGASIRCSKSTLSLCVPSPMAINELSNG